MAVKRGHETSTSDPGAKQVQKKVKVADLVQNSRMERQLKASLAKTYGQQLVTLGNLRRLPASFCPTTSALTPCYAHAVRSTTAKTPSPGNLTTPGKKSNRISEGRFLGISQLLVCNPKTKWRVPTSVQSQKIESTLGRPSFQNGDPQTGRPADSAVRLPDLHRPFRCVPTFKIQRILSWLSMIGNAFDL